MSGKDMKMYQILNIILFISIFMISAGQEVIAAYLLSKVKLNNKSSRPFFIKITVIEMWEAKSSVLP